MEPRGNAGLLAVSAHLLIGINFKRFIFQNQTYIQAKADNRRTGKNGFQRFCQKGGRKCMSFRYPCDGWRAA